MRVKPILFSPEMVRAILAGRKNQTRRVISGVKMFSPEYDREWFVHVKGPDVDGFRYWWEGPSHGQSCYHIAKLSYAPGDILYVREAWRTAAQDDHLAPSEMEPRIVGYQADCKGGFIAATGRLRAAMHMPRWASRITFKVTSVRVERVQDISEEDAKAEGVEPVGEYPAGTIRYRDYSGFMSGLSTAKKSFRALWNSLNTKRGYGWETNPWVSVTSFEPIIQNVDAYLAKEALR